MSLVDYVQSWWGSSASTTSVSTAAAASPSSTTGGIGSGLAFCPSANSSSAQQLGSGVWPLSPQMREEMKKGTRYNMKVVLRGTKATGKSTLMARLSGHPLLASYNPSTELIASTMRLQGEHTAAHEGIKVDMWEVVEEGRQRSASSSSPNTTAKAARHIPIAQLQEVLRIAADARLLDVYAGAHLVIFMIDPRQRASWEYAMQETLHVPPNCCVLYALNFVDTISSGSSPSAVRVALKEVQAYGNRMRRATTGVVHRMLEGREAPPEFSVPPMTAVLSAQTGAGMLGVHRALHVASTLLRIATEEVRVQRLFDLMARQQAVSISEDPPPAAAPAPQLQPSHQTHARTPSDARPFAAHSAAHDGAAAATGASAPVTQAPPPPPTSHNAALRTEHYAAPSMKPAAAGSLVMVHHKRDGVGNAEARGMSEAEAMRVFLGSSNSDASSRASSRTASPSSAAELHREAGARRAVGVGAVPQPMPRANGRVGSATPLPKDASTLDDGRNEQESGRRATIAGDAQGSALTVEQGAAAAAGDTLEASHVEGSTVEVATRPPPPVPPPAAVSLLDEVVVRVLANEMVHDVEAPTDDFFGGTDAASQQGKREEAGHDHSAADRKKANEQVAGNRSLIGASAVDLPIPSASPRPSSDSPDYSLFNREDGRTARPLGTQRIVRRTSTLSAAGPASTGTGTGISNSTAAATSAAHASASVAVDVATLLADMTAALTASVPEATLAAAMEREATSEVTNATESEQAAAAMEPPADAAAPLENAEASTEVKKKKSAKHHKGKKDASADEERHSRSHRKKHRNTAKKDAAEYAEDDGSFEILTT